MKSGFIDKLIGRLDRIEPGEVQAYLARLVREKGFLEKVFEALQEGVIVTDGDGVISYINRAACRFFGLDRRTTVGAELSTVVRGFDWTGLIAALGSGRTVSRDLEVFYPDNRYLNFYLSQVDPDEALGYLMLVRDITETRKMTEEKIESERLTALTMLAAGVAHELGNPLNSLHIHLQLIERRLRKSAPEVYEDVGELLDVTRDEVKRLDFIIDQFLGAIRPTHPELKLVNVNRLIRESVKFLESEMEDRRIVLELELHEGLPLMRIDADQMKQAFYNLIKNGAQAISGSGKIQVRTDMTDGEVTVSFADSGKGIPADEMGAVFEPFFTTKETGSGLGLLIVRRIVREHGGEIGLESEEGVGTRVTIYLPKVDRSVRLLGMDPGGGGEDGTAAGVEGERSGDSIRGEKRKRGRRKAR